MANAQKDGNRVSTLIALSSSDGTTIVPVKVDSVTNVLQVLDNTTGSDLGGSSAAHDGNRVTTLIGVSSSDGITPVDVYADASGNLLINSL